MRLAGSVAVAFLAFLLAQPAIAYDSQACGEGSEDCEGLQAARTPWVHAEHAQIWLQTRRLGG